MKRVMVIGSSGAGKSTLAKRLGNLLNVNVYHLDALFWKPNWVLTDKDEQREIQKELVENEEWVIDGTYLGTMDIRLHKADTVIFLDFHRTICMYRILKRRFQYRNKVRPDMGADCIEKIDLEFIKWVWNFPKTHRSEILRTLERYSNEKEIIVLTSKKEVNLFLQEVS